METTDYLEKKIAWERTEDPLHPFETELAGEKLVIRLNDFPDENLYTLIVDGKEIVNFDDWSAKWTRISKARAAGQSSSSKLSQKSRRQTVYNQRRSAKS